MKKCILCGEEFDNHSLYANHIRWKHKDNSEYKEKTSIKSIKINEKIYGKWIYDTVKCNLCGTNINIKYRENKKKEKYYCSVKCANTRIHSDETKNKISKSVSKLWKDDDYRKNIMKYVGKNQRFSSKGERDIRYKLKNLLGDNNVISHYLIKYNNISKSVDIYIPSKNIIIEYDGEWHFKKVMKEHDFDITIKKDKMVNEYCNINKIKLIRISDLIYKKNKDKYFNIILEEINNNDNKYIEIY
jgi:hypothetical protein